MATPIQRTGNTRRNLIVAGACASFFGSMIAVTYASAELYDLFCRVTGYGGTTQVATAAPAKVLDREITIRFDANVSPGLGWEFKPVQREVTLKIGESATISYEAMNILASAQRGKASFNVTPELAGTYFNKLQCFCFTDITLKPGEKLDMPVVFFVDPEIVNEKDIADIKTITLSYTMFSSADEKPLAEAKPLAGNKATDAKL